MTPAKKLEAQMKNSEIRSPMDGLLTGIKTIDGELVAEGTELFTVSSRKNYVRGEVNEEDVGEVKPGMEAVAAGLRVSNPAILREGLGDPARGRSGNAALHHRPRSARSARQPDGWHDRRNEHHYRHARKCSAVPTRALLVDQALIVKHGIVQGAR